MHHRLGALASVTVLGLLACGPGDKPATSTTATGTTSASEGSPGPDGGASATSTSAGSTTTDATTGPTYDPVACTPGQKFSDCPFPYPPPETFFKCDEASYCTSLMCSRDHCGECGHQCLAHCTDGRCVSASSACIVPEDGFRTCAEVCAAQNAQCEDEVGNQNCSRGYLWAVDDGTFGFSKCPYPTSSFGPGNALYEDAGCNEPIRWDHGTADVPQTGIICCCKGDLQ